MQQIKLRPDTFKTKNIRFQENYDDKKILKSVYVNYNDGDDKRIWYQTPRMQSPFGLSGYSYEGQPKKYTVQVSFLDNDDQHKKFKKTIEKLDNLIIDTATERKWMATKKNKNPTREIVANMYKSYINDVDEKNNYPASFKVSVDQNKTKEGELIEDSFRMNVFDMNKKKIESKFEEVMNPRCYVELLLKCNIWIGQGQFGCKWKIDQAKVESSANSQGYAFGDDSEEENDNDNDNNDDGENNNDESQDNEKAEEASNSEDEDNNEENDEENDEENN